MRKALRATIRPAVSTSRILVLSDDHAGVEPVVSSLRAANYELGLLSSDEIDQVCPECSALVLLHGLRGEIAAIETMKRLRQAAGNEWLPLILIVDRIESEFMSQCLQAGATDFVCNDLDGNELLVRIEAALRQRRQHEIHGQQLKELAYLQDQGEREAEIAQKIFQTIMAPERLQMPFLRHRASAMSVFNGDLLLASRTPDGGTHLLIGDFTGHGLSASIGTLPASEIFHAMSAKGFGIVDILREINGRLKHLLPVGMFMAGAGVQIDKGSAMARIWSGGIPEVLLRRADRKRIERFPSRHLPLGVLDDDDFCPEVDMVSLCCGDRLFLFTDGVTETARADGAMFGINRVRDIVGGAVDAAEAFDELNMALDVFRDGHVQNDDVTLLEYTCPEARTFEQSLPRVPDSRYDNEFNTEWQFRMHLDAAALRTFDPRPLVTQILMDIQVLYDDREPLYTIISEIFRVCLEQGVLGVEQPIDNNSADGLDYQREVAQRLARLEHGAIHVEIDHAAAYDGGALMLQFSQNGKPLDIRNCPTLRSLDCICASIQIVDEGQKVVGFYYWKSA